MKARRNKMLLTVLGGFVIFFSLVSVIAVLGNRADAVSLLSEGIKTQGVVERLDTASPAAGVPNRNVRQSRNNFVTVRFTDDTGKAQVQTATKYIGWNEYQALKVGDTVPVIYRRGSPYNLYLQGPLERLAGAVWGAWLAGLGILFGIGMIVAGTKIRLS